MIISTKNMSINFGNLWEKLKNPDYTAFYCGENYVFSVEFYIYFGFAFMLSYEYRK